MPSFPADQSECAHILEHILENLMSEPTACIIFERLLIPNGVSLLEVTDSFVATVLSLLSVGLLPSSLPLTLFSFHHISHNVNCHGPQHVFLPP